MLARHLCRVPGDHAFQPGDVPTRLKISDLPIFSCGQIAPGPDTDVIEWHDRANSIYGQLLIENNRLTGAILLGDTSSGPWYGELIMTGADISRHRDTIAFGKPYCDAAA